MYSAKMPSCSDLELTVSALGEGRQRRAFHYAATRNLTRVENLAAGTLSFGPVYHSNT